ncbi:MAG: GNAT family protein [Parachlamydiales bacterium]|jgi:RimJ/RimL family protein N-acetyltransferase
MIEGRNVKIRPLKEKEIGLFFSFLEAAMIKNEFLPFDIIESEFCFKKEFQSDGLWKENNGMAVILDFEDQIIGMISYNKAHFLDAFELKYIIFDEINRGKGYMKEALKLFSNYLFSSKKINRIQLTIPNYHRASIAVAQKCGYVFEGIAREAIFSNGEYLDVCVYSLLRREIKH